MAFRSRLLWAVFAMCRRSSGDTAVLVSVVSPGAVAEEKLSRCWWH